MTTAQLLQYRRYNQHISRPQLDNVSALVGWLSAVQAQDYAAAKWALGLRLGNHKDIDIEQAFNKGEIIRTHVLRPTWHFVSPADLRWMLQLTAPRVIQQCRFAYRQFDLDEKLFSKSNKVLEKALQGGRSLMRNEIALALNKAKISTDNLRFIHIMMRAELDGVVCSGPRIGKQMSYALLEERVPSVKPLTKEESLARLAQKYFSSHGPASLKDFAWWSGLLLNDAKIAVSLAKGVLTEVECEGSTYWMGKNEIDTKRSSGDVHLLPAYDEYLISYADRSAALDPEHFRTVALSNGIFNPVLIVKGRVAGTWKRSIDKNKLAIEMNLFEQLNAATTSKLNTALRRYGHYMAMKTGIV